MTLPRGWDGLRAVLAVTPATPSRTAFVEWFTANWEQFEFDVVVDVSIHDQWTYEVPEWATGIPDLVNAYTEVHQRKHTENARRFRPLEILDYPAILSPPQTAEQASRNRGFFERMKGLVRDLDLRFTVPRAPISPAPPVPANISVGQMEQMLRQYRQNAAVQSTYVRSIQEVPMRFSIDTEMSVDWGSVERVGQMPARRDIPVGTPPRRLGAGISGVSRDTASEFQSRTERIRQSVLSQADAFSREYLGRFPEAQRAGRSFMETDYSGLEMRVMSQMSEMQIEAILGLDAETVVPEDANEDQEEFEIVARTTTTRSTKALKSKEGSTFTRPAVYIWAMLSGTQKVAGTSVMYEVRLNDDNTTSCTCGAWRFKKKDQPRSCRHVKSIEAEAKDFFKKFKKGEALPTVDPTEEQLKALGGKGFGGTKAAGEDASDIKFGRVVEFD